MDTAATGPQADEAAVAAADPNAYPGELRYNPNWKKAKRNPVVFKWQMSLYARVYKGLKADGVYGPKTAACVNDWQTRRPQARNVDGLGKENMWYDLVLNVNPYHWGPCSSPACPAKGKLPTGASAEEEDEVNIDELVEKYDIENLLAQYRPNGGGER